MDVFNTAFCEDNRSYDYSYNLVMMNLHSQYRSSPKKIGLFENRLDDSMMEYQKIKTTDNFRSRHLLGNNKLRKEFIKKYEKLAGSISFTGYDVELKTSSIINDLLELANSSGESRLKSLLRRGFYMQFENEITKQTFLLSVSKKLFVQVSCHPGFDFNYPTEMLHTTNIKIVKGELQSALGTDEYGKINHMRGL